MKSLLVLTLLSLFTQETMSTLITVYDHDPLKLDCSEMMIKKYCNISNLTIILASNESSFQIQSNGIVNVYNGSTGEYFCKCPSKHELDFRVEVRSLSVPESLTIECQCFCVEIAVAISVVAVIELIGLICLVFRNLRFGYKTTFTNQII
ncbi:protein ORF55 [Goose adenovirus 4]|uniref:Protein ORF55 n=1 Tax=Goose adenovirus 4 TaxID=1193422 RepID=I3RSD0_9ADEN|nr:protein ORF55 [Goose adenovirus 4]AFK29215.1 protein ORF55 [Goose adenovirus 4]